MIVFKNITIKNFLGVGDTPITIDYQKNHTTLVSGTNGAGKSSIFTDSLTFALFGKPYRKINIPQLINSINKKSCLVVLNFQIGKSNYTIKRGLKPKIFEIYKDNKLVNQDAHNKDYQKYLEQHILKMNFKTFSQIVILSSSNFIPFMQLSASERRSVIEDLLDIQVFTRMNEILKEKVQNTKEDIEKNKTRQESIVSSLDVHKKYLQKKKTDDNEKLHKLTESKTSLLNSIDEMNNNIVHIKDTIINVLNDVIVSYDEESLKKNLDDIKRRQTSHETKYDMLLSEKEFFDTQEICKTCHQDITEEHKQRMSATLLDNIAATQENIITEQTLYKDIVIKYEELQNKKDEIFSSQQDIRDIESKIHQYQALLDKVDEEIIEVKAKSKESKTDYLKEIDDIKKEYISLRNKRTSLMNQLSLYNMALIMLKDSGIKTKIIKQYIPIMNTLINKFLKDMDFHIHFELDEQFNEVIKTRHRDKFTYESFSEGEKSRIDLALLFTWREIARIRNSASCSLLIMDETFDSSLDSNADDALINILYGLTNTNIFVISHKGSTLYDKFHSNIRLEKVKNFTKIA